LITFTDFLPVPAPRLTKVKFNMRSGEGSGEALDFLMDDHERWLNFIGGGDDRTDALPGHSTDTPRSPVGERIAP